MYDNDDFMNMLRSLGSSTETETEETTQSANTVNPQQSSYDYNKPYTDDYSVKPNYEEQKSYNAETQESIDNLQGEQNYQRFETPLIKQTAPAVNLTKKKQKIQLFGRMKIVAAVFSIIMASLIFVTIFNFVQANKIQAGLAGKQIEITELQSRISELQSEYNFLGSDEQIRQSAVNSGFVDIDDSNTIKVELGEMHSESVIEDLPSNWFNDVCEFLSNLFN